MRLALSGLMLALALLPACGGGDSNEPEDPFPDAAGVYQVSGGFDGIPSNVGSFSGTLEITQATHASGTLGPAAIVATIDGNVFNVIQRGVTLDVPVVYLLTRLKDERDAAAGPAFRRVSTSQLMT